MSKTVWIINQFSSTLDTGFGGRHYYFAKELAKSGFDVHLFASANHHLLQKKPAITHDIEVDKTESFYFHWIKGIDYSGAHSYKRVASEIEFLWSVSNLDFSDNKPNYIVYSSPSLIPFLAALFIAKKTGAKLILDIRDLWPLTLKEMGVSRFNPYVLMLDFIERVAYKRADAIISNWPLADLYIKKVLRKEVDFTWIPNGFSSSEFETSLVESSDLPFTIPKEKFVIGYTGTLGVANAIHTLLKAAVKLKHRKDIHIIIAGGGKLYKEIKVFLDENQLYNVSLLGPVDKNIIPSLLSRFDACYVGFLDISLYKYGSSLTKLPEYMAAGKPILYASSSPFQPIKESCAGITVGAEDIDGVVNGIIKLSEMPHEERIKLGQNGKRYAYNNFDYSKLSSKLEGVMSRI